jgi:hypothetical protein
MADRCSHHMLITHQYGNLCVNSNPFALSLAFPAYRTVRTWLAQWLQPSVNSKLPLVNSKHGSMSSHSNITVPQPARTSHHPLFPCLVLIVLAVVNPTSQNFKYVFPPHTSVSTTKAHSFLRIVMSLSTVRNTSPPSTHQCNDLVSTIWKQQVSTIPVRPPNHFTEYA